MLAAVFADGSIAALVALRPRGSTGHDADGVSAVLVERGKSAESAYEALVSTELDGDRRVRRVGVELWTSEEPPPRRARRRPHAHLDERLERPRARVRADGRSARRRIGHGDVRSAAAGGLAIPMAVTTIISDFGGVLTTPLMHSFAAFQDHSGIPPEALGKAMQRAADRDGAHPLFELECGRLTEAEFLAGLETDLEPELGHRPELHRFTEIYFDALNPNGPMVELMRELRDSGYRMALLTNNVREWEPLWRTMLPVDEIFELVVDSGFVGMRKPDAEIYALTLERLGDGVAAEQCLFVDDVEVNVAAARDLGMRAVRFRDNDQAIAEIRAELEAAR